LLPPPPPSPPPAKLPAPAPPPCLRVPHYPSPRLCPFSGTPRGRERICRQPTLTQVAAPTLTRIRTQTRTLLFCFPKPLLRLPPPWTLLHEAAGAVKMWLCLNSLQACTNVAVQHTVVSGQPACQQTQGAPCAVPLAMPSTAPPPPPPDQGRTQRPSRTCACGSLWRPPTTWAAPERGSATAGLQHCCGVAYHYHKPHVLLHWRHLGAAGVQVSTV
jgi:hypothetical protein